MGGWGARGGGRRGVEFVEEVDEDRWFNIDMPVDGAVVVGWDRGAGMGPLP